MADEPTTSAGQGDTDTGTTATATAATATTTDATPAATAAETGTTPAQEPAAPAASEQPSTLPERYDLTLPDQALLGDDDLAVIADEAKAMGLTQEQAQNLVQVRDTAVRHLSDRFLADAKADAEIGGDKFDETVRLAQAGLAFAFPQADELAQIRGWFNKTGLGNHKLFLRAMARIGRARAEDRPGATATTTAAEVRPTEDVLFGGAK